MDINKTKKQLDIELLTEENKELYYEMLESIKGYKNATVEIRNGEPKTCFESLENSPYKDSKPIEELDLGMEIMVDWDEE